MPRIEVDQSSANRHGIGGYGIPLLMDGREIPDLRRYTIDVRPDSVAEVRMTVFATERLHFVADQARVLVGIHLEPGTRLVETLGADGAKVYTAQQLTLSEMERTAAQVRTAADEVLAAVDSWASHVRGCRREECSRCEALMNQVVLAHTVYASSRDVARMVEAASRAD